MTLPDLQSLHIMRADITPGEVLAMRLDIESRYARLQLVDLQALVHLIEDLVERRDELQQQLTELKRELA